VRIPSRAILRISQSILLVVVITWASWLPTTSYAAGQITIDNAVTIKVIPPYETASPGGTVTVTLIVSNPAQTATFIATSCLLWFKSTGAWTLVNSVINSAYCLPASNFPHYFPPGDIEVWVISQSVSPTFHAGTLYWKLLGVGYWGDLSLGATGCCFAAISQWAYFTVTIT
jgi:hypothetical protein